jgi:hypothetical protein
MANFSLQDSGGGAANMTSPNGMSVSLLAAEDGDDLTSRKRSAGGGGYSKRSE